MSAGAFTFPRIEPGIYFGLDEATYHADPSFSCSLAKKLHVSAWHGWQNSRLNPHYKDKATRAKMRGRAYHAAVLEGADAFDASFAVAPKMEDHPGAIDSVADLKKAAAELGLQKVSSLTKEPLWRLIAQHDDNSRYVLWPQIMSEFQAKAGNRFVLTPDEAEEIQLGLFVLSRMPSVRNAFKGGYPEVSIFWEDEETGAPMKCRLDYLKLAGINDLKSFANMLDLPVKQAAIKSMLNQKNNMQPPIYLDGMAAAGRLYAQHGAAIVHGDVDPAWLARLMAKPPQRFTFVFLQNGGTPDIIPLEFRRAPKPGASMNGYYARGLNLYRTHLRTYVQCMKELGPHEPWIIDRAPEPIEDRDVPLYALDDEPEELEDAA